MCELHIIHMGGAGGQHVAEACNLQQCNSGCVDEQVLCGACLRHRAAAGNSVICSGLVRQACMVLWCWCFASVW
jgi:hypothetical protein